jgi:hypothetical protein
MLAMTYPWNTEITLSRQVACRGAPLASARTDYLQKNGLQTFPYFHPQVFRDWEERSEILQPEHLDGFEED